MVKLLIIYQVLLLCVLFLSFLTSTVNPTTVTTSKPTATPYSSTKASVIQSLKSSTLPTPTPTSTYTAIGPYADKPDRALRYGPQSYGYTPDTCQMICITFVYFALQDNGWCSCDNDWSHVIKYGPSSCGPSGGRWCNYVYQNLMISSSPSSSTVVPTVAPFSLPSAVPTVNPTTAPTASPSVSPSHYYYATNQPTANLIIQPTSPVIAGSGTSNGGGLVMNTLFWMFFLLGLVTFVVLLFLLVRFYRKHWCPDNSVNYLAAFEELQCDDNKVTENDHGEVLSLLNDYGVRAGEDLQELEDRDINLITSKLKKVPRNKFLKYLGCKPSGGDIPFYPVVVADDTITACDVEMSSVNMHKSV
jgi:hypothetical protein